MQTSPAVTFKELCTSARFPATPSDGIGIASRRRQFLGIEDAPIENAPLIVVIGFLYFYIPHFYRVLNCPAAKLQRSI